MAVDNIGVGLSSIIRLQTGNGGAFSYVPAPASTASTKTIRFGMKNFALRTIDSDGRYCLSIYDVNGLSPAVSTDLVNIKGKTFSLKTVTVNSIVYNVLVFDNTDSYSLSTEVATVGNIMIAKQDEKIICYTESFTPDQYDIVKFGDRNVLTVRSGDYWYLSAHLV